MGPQVSVVIPTHNRGDVVSRAIRSALVQTYDNLEVIVVDDGSDDNTREMVTRISDRRVRYIRHDGRRGGGAARNAGIAAAQGEYVAFLDSDDEWLPEKLEKQVPLLQAGGPAVGAVYAGYVVADERGGTRVRVPRWRGHLLDELLCGNRVGTASTVLVRRSALLAVGGFDPSLASCQDWDLWIRLSAHCELESVPQALVRYHVDGEARITSDAQAVVDGHLRIAEKHLNPADRRSLPRAQQFFVCGKRLIALGHGASHAEAVRQGRRLLLAAFRQRPLALHYVLFYAASFSRLAYRVLTGAGPRLRALRAPSAPWRNSRWRRMTLA